MPPHRIIHRRLLYVPPLTSSGSLEFGGSLARPAGEVVLWEDPDCPPTEEEVGRAISVYANSLTRDQVNISGELHPGERFDINTLSHESLQPVRLGRLTLFHVWKLEAQLTQPEVAGGTDSSTPALA